MPSRRALSFSQQWGTAEGNPHGPVPLKAVGVWREEKVGGPPGGGFSPTSRARDAAALAFDVPVQVVGAREALVAVLALVRPHARVNAQVVLQVVVVNKLRVTVQADVRSLARVLAHVNLQLVLPGKEKRLKMRFEVHSRIRKSL